jgi:hypothetical protein
MIFEHAIGPDRGVNYSSIPGRSILKWNNRASPALRTPSGALRKTGWYMKLSGQRQNSRDFLQALKQYSELLDKTHGKNAFKYFSRADFRVLTFLNSP